MLRTVQRSCIGRSETRARASGNTGMGQTGAARGALASVIAGDFDVLTGVAGCCGHMVLLE